MTKQPRLGAVSVCTEGPFLPSSGSQTKCRHTSAPNPAPEDLRAGDNRSNGQPRSSCSATSRGRCGRRTSSALRPSCSKQRHMRMTLRMSLAPEHSAWICSVVNLLRWRMVLAAVSRIFRSTCTLLGNSIAMQCKWYRYRPPISPSSHSPARTRTCRA